MATGVEPMTTIMRREGSSTSTSFNYRNLQTWLYFGSRVVQQLQPELDGRRTESGADGMEEDPGHPQNGDQPLDDQPSGGCWKRPFKLILNLKQVVCVT